MKPFIGYHFFHGTGRIDRAKAYTKVQQAMEIFSNQKSPSHLSLMLEMRDDRTEPLESLCQKLCKTLGPVAHTTTTPTWPDYRAYSWNLNAEQFQELFLLLDSLDQQDSSLTGRMHLGASWFFKFVEPTTGQVLPDQENLPVIDFRLGPGSSLNFSTGKKTSANAWFLFPFEDPSSEFEDYALRFQKQLIFKFSPEHWRLWRFSSGEWRPRRFVPPWYDKKVE